MDSKIRKAFLKLLLVSIPVVVVLAAIEIFYRTVPNNYSYKANAVSGQYRSAEVLILGGSHTFYGLNPAFFEQPAFNLAAISQSIYFDRLLFDKYPNDMPNLKYVILNAEYYSLSMTDDAAMNEERKNYYHGFMDIRADIVSPFDAKAHMLSWNRNFKTNVNLITSYLKKGSILYCDPNGFGNIYKKEEAIGIELATESMREHEDHSLSFTMNVSRLQHIISACRSRGIKVLLVTMPVASTYADLADKNKLRLIIEACKTLERKNSNLKYINLFSDPRFNDADFYDADHLHDEGAEKCSKIVNAEIRSF